MTSNTPNIISAGRYFAVTFSVLLILTAIAILVLGENYFTWFLSIPFYFAVSIISFYFIIKRLITVPGNKFFTYYLGVIFTKFFIAIIFLVFYLVLIKQHNTFFAITFFIYYIVFSAFETRLLMKINKQAGNSEK